MTLPTSIVTLADVHAHLNIDPSDTTHDTELQGFIDAATAYVQHQTGDIIAAEYFETHNGGRNTIRVDHPPILSVQEVVEYVGQTGYTLTEVTLAESADVGTYSYSLDNPRGGVIQRRWNGGMAGPFTGGNANVTVAYTAGTNTVGADIRMAVLQDIAALWQPGQTGTNPYGSDDEMGGFPLDTVNMFPKVAAILSAPAMKIQAIG